MTGKLVHLLTGPDGYNAAAGLELLKPEALVAGKAGSPLTENQQSLPPSSSSKEGRGRGPGKRQG